jgi:hypothetical protein
MRRISLALLLALTSATAALAGDAEIKAAQSTIESQLRAFQAGDGNLAYSFAAPTIQQMFPTPEIFMGMVEQGYQPVFHPQSFSFGQAEELSGTSIAQRVMLVGPDGKDYEALYQLELQPDGKFKITGVSLRAAQSLST